MMNETSLSTYISKQCPKYQSQFCFSVTLDLSDSGFDVNYCDINVYKSQVASSSLSPKISMTFHILPSIQYTMRSISKKICFPGMKENKQRSPYETSVNSCL